MPAKIAEDSIGPGGNRISRRPGFRGGFDLSPDAPRLTIDEREISGALNSGPRGSRVTSGPGPVARVQAATAGPSRRRTQFVGHSGRVRGGGRRVGPASSEELGRPRGAAKAPDIGRAAMAQRLTIYIPVPRLLARAGGHAQSLFTTVVISVPRFDTAGLRAAAAASSTDAVAVAVAVAELSHQRDTERDAGCGGHRQLRGARMITPRWVTSAVRAPLV